MEIEIKSKYSAEHLCKIADEVRADSLNIDEGIVVNKIQQCFESDQLLECAKQGKYSCFVIYVWTMGFYESGSDSSSDSDESSSRIGSLVRIRICNLLKRIKVPDGFGLECDLECNVYITWGSGIGKHDDLF